MSEIKFKTGDCRILTKELKDNSIDMVFTDPPYNISSNTKIVMKNHPKQKRNKDRLLTYDFGSWDHFESKEEFLDFTEQWMKECFRVLKPTGNFVSFFG
jgi:DNA modification methylase